jgi:hypothetical protein
MSQWGLPNHFKAIQLYFVWRCHGAVDQQHLKMVLKHNQKEA